MAEWAGLRRAPRAGDWAGGAAGGAGEFRLVKDIDREFEEFVQKNYNILTDYQKKICRKLGITVPF